MKRKILFYGDSNTYGFDPRDFFGGRYDERFIWTQIVADHLKEQWVVYNEGMNGRELPVDEWDLKYVRQLLARLSEDDVFAIMLGTNDLLFTLNPNADVPIQRMEKFLDWLMMQDVHPQILVIAPPYVAGMDGDSLYKRFAEESVRMNEGFRRAAAGVSALFADAAGWGVELAYDRVHFSENGHAAFAKHLLEFLEDAIH